MTKQKKKEDINLKRTKTRGRIRVMGNKKGELEGEDEE